MGNRTLVRRPRAPDPQPRAAPAPPPPQPRAPQRRAPRRGRRAGTRGSGASRGHLVLTGSPLCDAPAEFAAPQRPRDALQADRRLGLEGARAARASALPPCTDREGLGRVQPPWTPSFLLRGVSTLWIGRTQGLLQPAAAERVTAPASGRLFGRTSGGFQLLLGLGAGPRVSAGWRQRHCPTPTPYRAEAGWGEVGGRGGPSPCCPRLGREDRPHLGTGIFYLQRRRPR